MQIWTHIDTHLRSGHHLQLPDRAVPADEGGHAERDHAGEYAASDKRVRDPQEPDTNDQIEHKEEAEKYVDRPLLIFLCTAYGRTTRQGKAITHTASSTRKGSRCCC